MTKQQSNYIKIIAILTMLIDHAGLILFPQYPILRIIGRIAFPLFAYQIGIGFSHTRDVKKYFLRLFIFGAVIQIFYSVAAAYIGEEPWMFNIFFTLALGVLAISTFKKQQYVLTLCVLIIPFLLGLVGITIDYGTYGVLLILGMYITRNNILYLAIYTILLTTITCLIWDYPIRVQTQMNCLLALPFIAKPFSVKTNIPWWFFYLFYPLHLVLLYAIGELPFF